MTHPSTLRHLILTAIRRYRMMEPGMKVLVAVSGGADSVFLLHWLVHLRPLLQVELAVAHLDHRIRPDSLDDLHFTAELAEILHLPFFGHRLQKPLEKKPGQNLEEQARIARMAFLEETLRRWGGHRIALGHTLTDAAETLLFHLFRGAGFTGLSGLRPVRLPYVRPLILIRREAVRAYLQKEGIPFREDPTNQDLSRARNFIRLQVIPLVEERFPGLQDHLFAVSRLNQEIVEDLQSRLPALEQLVDHTFFGNPVIPVEALERLPRVLQRWFAYQVLGANFKESEEFLRLLQCPSGRVDLRGGRLIRSFGWLLWERTLPPRPPGPQRWEGPSLRLPQINLLFQVAPTASCAPPHPLQACWPEDAVGGPPFTIRTIQPGDRLEVQPGRWKKVKFLLQTHRVPQWIRSWLPVVEDARGLLWIPGVAQAHRPGQQDRWVKMEVKKANEHEPWLFDYCRGNPTAGSGTGPNPNP